MEVEAFMNDPDWSVTARHRWRNCVEMRLIALLLFEIIHLHKLYQSTTSSCYHRTGQKENASKKTATATKHLQKVIYFTAKCVYRWITCFFKLCTAGKAVPNVIIKRKRRFPFSRNSREYPSFNKWMRSRALSSSMTKYHPASFRNKAVSQVIAICALVSKCILRSNTLCEEAAPHPLEAC